MLNLLQQNAPVFTFVVGALLLGGLINEYPPTDKVVVGDDFKCPFDDPLPQVLAVTNEETNETDFFQLEDYVEEPTRQSILSKPVVTVITTFLPLLPILVPSLVLTPAGGKKFLHHLQKEETWKLFLCHLVGQSASFSSSELARFVMVQPNKQFFRDCNLGEKKCSEIEKEGRKERILVEENADRDAASSSSEDPTRVLCRNTTFTYSELYQNLHGFPDVASALVGAAAVSFTLSIYMRIKNKEAKTTVTTHEGGEDMKEFTRVRQEEPKEDEEGEEAIQFTARRPAEVEEGKATRNHISPASAKTLNTLKPILMLLFLTFSISVLILLLADQYLQAKNSPSEMLFSVLIGVCFQLAINYYFIHGGHKLPSGNEIIKHYYSGPPPPK
jgi:hypothetical protein